jgi:hypothetical protein
VTDESRALAHFIATTAHDDVPSLVRANALATIVDA